MTNLTLETIDIRDAFFDELYRIACEDESIIFLTADMGAKRLGRFRKDLPERFINLGIAEQNMISIAAGLTLGGKRVFAYAIVPFLVGRCFDQIKVDLCAMGLPVSLVGSGPGLSYAPDGPTHHAIEDISIMRALPGMTVLNPCDHLSSRTAARLAYESKGPVYVRIDKGSLPPLYGAAYDFSEGMACLKDGSDVFLIATGKMSRKAFDVARRLGNRSIDAGIIDVFRIKPFDTCALLRLIGKVKAIVTIEEHTLIGGIGSAIVESLADEGIMIRVKRFGINDEYATVHGSREYLHEVFGLDAETIAIKIFSWLNSF